MASVGTDARRAGGFETGTTDATFLPIFIPDCGARTLPWILLPIKLQFTNPAKLPLCCFQDPTSSF